MSYVDGHVCRKDPTFIYLKSSRWFGIEDSRPFPLSAGVSDPVSSLPLSPERYTLSSEGVSKRYRKVELCLVKMREWEFH